jgi:hypothetical protein
MKTLAFQPPEITDIRGWLLGLLHNAVYDHGCIMRALIPDATVLNKPEILQSFAEDIVDDVLKRFPQPTAWTEAAQVREPLIELVRTYFAAPEPPRPYLKLVP